MPSVKPMRTFMVLAALAGLWLGMFFPTPALAHKVFVYAWVEGDRVQVEGYFSRSQKVQGGRVEVFGPDGRKLLAGKTDEKGLFSFKIPQKTDLKIVLTASMGHKNDYTLKADELAGGGSTSRPTPAPASKPEARLGTAPAGEPRTASPPVAAPAVSQIDEDRLRAMIDEALDRKLQPLIRAMAQANEPHGPGLTEILGGLGYILGILGVVMYMRSRGKR